MSKNTKQKIIESGAGIIHLKGFNHAGIQEILDAAGVPKGSFYNYFKNKEDFGLQVVDFFVDQFIGLTEGTLANGQLGPRDKIRALLEGFIAFFESRDCRYGCPVGNLSQEMGDLSPAFRGKLKTVIDAMAGIYAGLIGEAQAAGEVPKTLDAGEAGYFIVSSWHGALVRMKVEKNSAPLNNHLRFILDYVLRP